MRFIAPCFPGDLFSELERLQREFQQNFDASPAYAARAAAVFPAINVGSGPGIGRDGRLRPWLVPPPRCPTGKGVLTWPANASRSCRLPEAGHRP